MAHYTNILNCKSTSISGYPSFVTENPRWTVNCVNNNEAFDKYFFIDNKNKKVQYRLNDIVVGKLK